MNFVFIINKLLYFTNFLGILMNGIESKTQRKSYFRRLKNTSYYVHIPTDHDQFLQLIKEHTFFKDNQESNNVHKSTLVINNFEETNKKQAWLNTDENSINNNEWAEENALPHSIRYLSPKIIFGNQSITSSVKNSLSYKGCGIQSNKYIVGGEEAPEGSHPWMALVFDYGGIWCTATIINEMWLVTVAHAFKPIGTDPKGITIGVGSTDRTQLEIYKVNKISMHQSYNNDRNEESDIALIRVDTPIIFNKNVRPICLPQISYQKVRSSWLLAAGWGFTSYQYGYSPVKLHQVKLDVFPIERCAQKYLAGHHRRVYKTQICTFSVGKDACQRDSGGPLIEYIGGKATLVGIVSYGVGCATDYPGVFTKVSYFLNWIQNEITKYS